MQHYVQKDSNRRVMRSVVIPANRLPTPAAGPSQVLHQHNSPAAV